MTKSDVINAIAERLRAEGFRVHTPMQLPENEPTVSIADKKTGEVLAVYDIVFRQTDILAIPRELVPCPTP